MSEIDNNVYSFSGFTLYCLNTPETELFYPQQITELLQGMCRRVAVNKLSLFLSTEQWQVGRVERTAQAKSVL